MELVVEEAFVARGRGVLLAPRFTTEAKVVGTFRVRLVLPSGEERETSAEMEVSHMRGALAPYAMLRLPEMRPEDVPPGTRVLMP